MKESSNGSYKQQENDTSELGFQFSEVNISENIISIGTSRLNIKLITDVIREDCNVSFKFFSRRYVIMCSNVLEAEGLSQKLKHE